MSLPLRRKLMTMMLLTTAAVLLLSCVALFIYEYTAFRRSIMEQTATLARIIATNSTAALAFRNQEDAEEVLNALRTEPHITLAALYDGRGMLFARYPADAADGRFPPHPEQGGYRFDGGFLHIFQLVREGENPQLGVLYVRSDMDAIYERFSLYATVIAGIIAASLVLTYILSNRFQRLISQPILALTETASAISERGDYSVRAPAMEQVEFGVLTNAFNQMLARIAAQNSALQLNHERLRGQLARLDLLQRTTRAIAERQDLQSILQVIVRSLEDNLPIDFGCICQYNSASNALTVVSIGAKSTAFAAQLRLDMGASLAVDQNALQHCVEGGLIYEPDVRQHKHPLLQRLTALGLCSMVATPLLVEGKLFGILLVARRQAAGFSSGDCEFLRQLCEHVAIAAHQVQLYTQLQQAYEDLQQSQQSMLQQERLRALGQMASGIAHDINNAISPIALYTESLLEHEPGLSKRATDYLRTIQRAIQDVAQTVARMREFYRRDQQTQLVALDLNPLIEQVLQLTRARWSDIPQERGIVIQVHSDLDAGLPAIMGTESDIRDALTNLIFNSVDAMPNGGMLTLRTRALPADDSRASGPLVQLEVSDSGTGMSDEIRRRCLEPFFTTKGERGTGMGLAMVYGMIKRHAASIEIDSSPGAGTTIRLTFGCAASHQPSVESAGEPMKATRPLHLLVVDDDPLLTESLLNILQAEGHVITVAEGGAAGIDTFTQAHRNGKMFDAVITDLGMPYVDGRAVAAAVKKLSPAMPIILLTGWGQRLTTERSVPDNIDFVLSKPPKLHDLRRTLAGLTPAARSLAHA